MQSVFRVVLLCVGLLALTCIASWSQVGRQGNVSWVPAIMHLHTYWSDGELSLDTVVELARTAGARVVLVSDHAEMISKPTIKLDFLGLSTKVVWVDKHQGAVEYCRAITQAQNRFKDMIIIPGVEIGCGQNRHCHMGFYTGDLNILVQAISLSERLGESDQEIPLVIQKLRSMGGDNCFIVANHMTTTYFTSEKHLALYDGVEFFNHSPLSINDKLPFELDDGSLSGVAKSDSPAFVYDALNRAQERSLLKAPVKIFAAVSGGDYHGQLVEDVAYAAVSGREVTIGGGYRLLGIQEKAKQAYLPSLKRFTMIGVGSFTPYGVVQALRANRCYAAFADARIISGPMPGSIVDPNLAPRIVYQFSGLDPQLDNRIRISFHEIANSRPTYSTSEVRPIVMLDLKGYLKPSQGNNGWIMGVLAPGLALNGILILPFNDPSDIRDERVALERYRPVNVQTPPPEVEQQPQIEEDEPEETDTPEERDNDDFWGNLARGLMLYLELSGLGIFGPRPGDGRDDEDRPNGGDDEPAMGPEGPLRIPVAPRR